MRKSLFLFVMLLTSLLAHADVFTAPDQGTYPGSYTVIAQLKINGTTCSDITNVEFATLVGGECRDVISASQNTARFNANNNFFMIRAWGQSSDNNKDVTFKVIIDGIAYNLNTKLKYVHDDSYDKIPLTLNVDKVTGVTIPATTVINQNLNTTFDLSALPELTYNSTDGAPVTPTGESSIDTDLTPIKYIWDVKNNTPYFTVTDNTLTTKGEVSDAALHLSARIPRGADWMEFGHAVTLVTISVPLVPVSSITVPAQTGTFWVGDNLAEILSPQITVAPDNASNKSVTYIQKSGPQDGLDATFKLQKAGTYVITVQSVSTPSVQKDITITVGQHVEDMVSTTSTITVNVGENVFDALRSLIVISPADATNQEIIFSGANPDFISAEGIALRKATKDMGVRIKAVSADNASITKEFDVIIENPVTGITASATEISVIQGTNVRDYINGNVSISLNPGTVDQTAWEAVPADNDAAFFPENTASTSGDYTWEIRSTENKDIKTTITVHVTDAVALSCPGTIAATISTPAEIKLTVTKGAENFDPALVSITFEDETAAQVSGTSADGLTLTVTCKKMHNIEFHVMYDGMMACSGKLDIGAEITIRQGWNWIANYTSTTIALQNAGDGKYKSEYFSGANSLIEIRSQEGLLINDPTYGVFGQITDLAANTMYKVNAKGNQSIVVYGTPGQNPTVSRKGYTWIAYPVIGNHTMNYFNENSLLAGAAEGDAIIGKNGFAEYDGTKWVASDDFMLETGKGYIYYQEKAAQKTLNFGDSYVEEPVASSAKGMAHRSSVWQYDDKAYPECMCIVAKLNGIEASGNYTVGAFVGDECRGKGSFVGDDLLFINVAGKTGETVRFQLYNYDTDEYTEITEKMSYATKKGSLNAPVEINASETTAVKSVNAATEIADATYNVAGQNIDSAAKGIKVVKGRKFYSGVK